MTAKILVITGMHRSGTSLTAQYLGECGLHLGETLHNSDKSNPLSAYDGHHEDHDFLSFHKRILAEKRIYSFPTNSFRLPVTPNGKDKKKAIELISARSHLLQWSWKDPRTTLFLDFWNRLLDSPKYLFLIRHPLAVVDSLIRRGNDSKVTQKPIIGLRSWKVYNKQILRFWKNHNQNCLIYDIDELTQSPEFLIKCLDQKLGILLQLVPFEKVFSQKALRPNYSNLVEELQKRYSKDVSDSLQLYDEIRALSVGQTAKAR